MCILPLSPATNLSSLKQGILFCFIRFLNFLNLLASILILSSYNNTRGTPPVQGLSFDLYRVPGKKAKSQVSIAQGKKILVTPYIPLPTTNLDSSFHDQALERAC